LRSHRLDGLFSPLSALKGVGDKALLHYARLLNVNSPRCLDLILHTPVSLVDRRVTRSLIETQAGEAITVEVYIEAHRPPQSGKSRAPYKIIASDATGDISLLFFHTTAHLAKLLPIGEKRIISGKLEIYDGMRQVVHPERIVHPKDADSLPLFEPVYPLTAGLTQGLLSRVIANALPRSVSLKEWLDATILIKKAWPSFSQSLSHLHHPSNDDGFSCLSPSWQRLAYDELLAGQLALALVRASLKKDQGRSLLASGNLKQKLLTLLPFTLTNAQQKTIIEIEQDLAASERMVRLLQGDVGAGKTLVAFFALLHAVESGKQTALMVPTEILARQHFNALKAYCAQLGVSLALLTRREKGKTLEQLATGAAQIVIGTHALFQEAVVFNDLALVVIDEQHRFGVNQRLTLTQKGEAVDLLVMTATPIPRTLVLTHFGDMDISILNEKPKGRKPIDTRVMSLERLPEIIEGLKRKLNTGAQAYWVCPLVNENEELDLMPAVTRYEALNKLFPLQTALVHGQMKSAEKDAAMNAFKTGQVKILVATTVIEVGVDVPNASVMIIEHAERFGLSQLHQLRGRVGRGEAASTCLLLYKLLGKTSRERLDVMRKSEDGFFIAQKDLELRGEGDLIGQRQSGQALFKIAQLEHHQDLLELARKEARLIVENDPQLASQRGAYLQDLLHIFGKEEAAKLISSG
jgi:ATP-dependent DNA helicase RecG